MTKTFKQQKLKLLGFSFLAFLFLSLNTSAAFASGGGDGEEVDLSEMIMHHISDSHEWHFFDGATLHLPVILYSSDRGIEVFSSSNFFGADHNVVDYNGYKYEHGHIIPV
ncbi:MAG: hypothetical protein AAFO69_07860, partial [Bacteroidota bacterium]